MKRIAINGFGRIGRLVLRNLLSRKDVEVVAINDLTDNATLAHLFKYDSAHGIYPGSVSSDEGHITINGYRILSLSERDPSRLPWKENEVDVVLECTGVFRSKDKASLHLEAGAKKVLLSAPGKDEHFTTIVMGINEGSIDNSKQLFSNASCTTNCLAPVVKILHEEFGFQQGSMTTIHAYTADQRIQDAPHSDLRRARAAAVNMIPTSTGAAVAVQKVYPAIKGRLMAGAVRVPTITGSLVDLACILEKNPSADDINGAFQKASEGAFKGILEYCTDPIVSSDIIGNTHSSIFDSLLTSTSGNFAKVTAWYDNEAGYAARLADIANLI
jgi:glyceraldehyde 3-phosphate dehydrogenase